MVLSDMQAAEDLQELVVQPVMAALMEAIQLQNGFRPAAAEMLAHLVRRHGLEGDLPAVKFDFSGCQIVLIIPTCRAEALSEGTGATRALLQSFRSFDPDNRDSAALADLVVACLLGQQDSACVLASFLTEQIALIPEG